MDKLACLLLLALFLSLLGYAELKAKRERPTPPSRFELLDPDNHEEVSVGDSNIYYRVNVKKETSDGPA